MEPERRISLKQARATANLIGISRTWRVTWAMVRAVAVVWFARMVILPRDAMNGTRARPITKLKLLPMED